MNMWNIFDPFVRDYLTLTMKQISSREAIYEKFKEQYPKNDNSEQLAEIIKEILHYAKYYVKMVLPTRKRPRTSEVFFRISQSCKRMPSYPFLLEVYDNYDSRADQNSGFRKNPSTRRELRLSDAPYVVCRRSVMNKVFASLMNEVDKNNYLESLNNAFLDMDTNKRYPTDIEFKEAFIHKDVYNFNRRDYLFLKLENYERSKEPIEVLRLYSLSM